MRRFAGPLALAVLFLVLTACALPRALTRRAAESADAFVVYRTAADGSAGGELLRAEPFVLPETGGSELAAALSAFSAPSADASLRCALPAGVTVEGFSLENGVVTLTLSDRFLDESEMERTTTAFCAVLTLCQLDGVEAVTILAGGQTVFAGLMPEDALLTAEDTDPYVRRLRLYFADADGRYLVSEYHSLTLDEDTSPERYVVEELLRGPNNGELRSALPAGTKLLSCSTTDGVCTVDLSAAFWEDRPATALGERLAVYTLVDSLTALSDVESVRILVEGEAIDTYVYRSLSEPLSRYEEPIGPASAPKGELDADLYLALPGLSAIAPLPFRVNAASYASPEEALIAELLGAAEPGYPALFPSSAAVTDITVRGAVCTVDLSEGFFASLPEEARGIAVNSMAATLCGLEEIDAVRFTIGGESAVFDGTDWSGPWRDFTDYLEE